MEAISLPTRARRGLRLPCNRLRPSALALPVFSALWLSASAHAQQAPRLVVEPGAVVVRGSISQRAKANDAGTVIGNLSYCTPPGNCFGRPFIKQPNLPIIDPWSAAPTFARAVNN